MAETNSGESTDGYAQKMMNAIDGSATMLTKYFFVAEGLDNQGRRAIYTASTDDMALWDELALVNYARNRVNAKQLALDLRDLNDD